MIRGLYTSAAGMMAEQIRQDTTANNLANINTTAYKKDQAVFRTFPEMLLKRIGDKSPEAPGLPVNPLDRRNPQRPTLGRMGTGSIVDQVVTNFTVEGTRQTGNPLDLAVTGDGFFAVQTPQGERYTRNGAFKAQAVPGQPQLSQMVNDEGFPVLNEQGAPVQFPSNGRLEIDEQGRVFVNDALVATIRQVTFAEVTQDPALRNALNLAGTPDDSRSPIKKVGDSLYGPNDLGPNPNRQNAQGGAGAQAAPAVQPLAVPPQFRRIRQGYLELPNTNPVTEMVNMIQVTRAYEANQKMIQAQDGTLERAIQAGGL